MRIAQQLALERDHCDAGGNRRQRIAMTPAPALLAQVADAFRRGDWPRTLALAGPLLQQAPTHAGVHAMTGIAALESGRLAPALEHLQRAVELAPSAELLAQWARALAIARDTRKAQAAADRAWALAPQHPRILNILGWTYAQVQAHARSADAFRRAVDEAPSHPPSRYNLATALVTLGEAGAAERELETCLAQDPAFWRAHLTLAHLRRQTPANNHVQRLSSLLASQPGDEAAMCLHLALAKEYEDLADYPRAFEHLTQGKAISRRRLDYSPDADAALFDALMRAFPEPCDSETGDPSEEPIFVFGLPRTGTTLVERILSSHPQVVSAGELQNFGQVLRQAWPNRQPLWRDPDIAASTRAVDWRRVGRDYLASTRPATGQHPHFIDKLPYNFLYAGFIARALPKARLICLRRNPLDSCLSSFRQLFAEKLPYYNYTFDLLDTGRYYVQFDRMMAHWRRVLPGRVLEVQYEELVHSQEAGTRQLLEFCGLPWDDACLHFETNQAPVGTASALQVREPMYRDAVRRWKHYEPQLDGLKQLLASEGVDVGA
jgi:tetratricopeptide (TPR) repeat protein